MARPLLAEQLPQALAAAGPSSRVAAALQTMAAFLHPECGNAGWWLALDSGWMPSGAWPQMRQVLAETEGWRPGEIRMRRTPISKTQNQWTATIGFHVKEISLFKWLRLTFLGREAFPSTRINGVPALKTSGADSDIARMHTQLDNAIPVKPGENEVEMTFTAPTDVGEQELRAALNVESAEAPLLRLLAHLLKQKSASSPADGVAPDPAWQAAISRSRARVADLLATQERAALVLREILPAGHPMAVPRRSVVEASLEHLAFLPLLDALENYPLSAGVTVDFVELAAQRIRAAAISSVQNNGPELVAAALPRLVALGEKIVSNEKEGHSAEMRDICEKLVLELKAMVQRSGKR